MSHDLQDETGEFLKPGDGPAPGASVPTASISVEVAARTHVGLVRENNEDNFHVVEFGRHLRTLLTSLPDGEVPENAEELGYGFAVADGMGGMAAGEVASRLALRLFVEHALGTPDWLLGRGQPYSTMVLDRAAQRFQDVNDAVLREARLDPTLRGMGSTLSMALSFGSDLYVAHVGDSPVFLRQGGALHRLTRDHTMGVQLALLGRDDAAQFQNVLTHAIGIRGTGGEPDIRRLDLADGDRLLLCTDGLTDMVDDPEIARILAGSATSREACDALIDLALDHGGRDNATAIVATFRIPPARPPA
jgi:protein phosphatase